MKIIPLAVLLLALGVQLQGRVAAAERGSSFAGQYVVGEGNTEYLRLQDTARRMLSPDPEFQNLSMLYMPSWNGFVEGPTWDAWWIQNSYGTTYSALPFLEEPYATWLQNSHDLWFDQMGDGKRVGAEPPFNWVAPDGCLCDAARPGWIVYRQGDGRTHIHDWGMEFTAAGLLLQSEVLLIRHDPGLVARYLPRLERCARFIETRRDPTNNLFLVGPAGNLLAPSYAGWKKPDGSYGRAYLTGLSVTYIAALDRLIEVEKFAGRAGQAREYQGLRDSARRGLARLTTEEGYLIRSLDPDGVRHGVFGAEKHGYFEASPNHDAIALRVVDDAQASRIYEKIAGIPGLRPHDFIIPNYPSYDDMYEAPQGLWAFGTWVNGGHWSTCEARMMLAYARLGKHDDAVRSMRRLMGFAERFRMDNPLVKFGSDVYQPNQPINLTYDAFGPAAGFLRGAFEYLYRADALVLMPHLPEDVIQLEQRFPVVFGGKRLYLATRGHGTVARVLVNGEPWKLFTPGSVTLPYDQLPDLAKVLIHFTEGTQGTTLAAFTNPAAANTPRRLREDDWAWTRARAVNIAPNQLPLRIGADSDGGNRWLGDLARVRIFNRALAESELAELHRAGASGSPLANDPSLVADWIFDKPENGAFVSKAGARLKARIVGQIQPIRGDAGPAIRLDGQGYLEVADCADLDFTEACTVEVIAAPSKLPPGGARLVDKSQVGTENGYLLDTYPGNSLRWISQAGVLAHGAALKPGEQVHLAGVVAPGGGRQLHVQGRRVAGGDRQDVGSPTDFRRVAGRAQRFHELLVTSGLGASYEAAHARLVIDALAVAQERAALLREGGLQPLKDPASAIAAERLYLETARKLSEGLTQHMNHSATNVQVGGPSRALPLWRTIESR